MTSDPRWPITRFGVDMTKAVPYSVQSIGGVNVEFPSLIGLPTGDSGQLSDPTIVTTASYTIVNDTVVVIQRAAPAATTLNLPALSSRQNIPLFIFDFSTGVTLHQITLTPNGADVIMNRSSWILRSTVDQLAGAYLLPFNGLPGWTLLA